MFLPFAFNNVPRCSGNCLSLHGFLFASEMKPKYPLESLLAGKRVRSWNFSAQNSRIKKHRVKKGLGWFGLAVYFTAIPPHVHYKGVDNHLWGPWCTPSIPEKLSFVALRYYLYWLKYHLSLRTKWENWGREGKGNGCGGLQGICQVGNSR